MQSAGLVSSGASLSGLMATFRPGTTQGLPYASPGVPMHPDSSSDRTPTV